MKQITSAMLLLLLCACQAGSESPTAPGAIGENHVRSSPRRRPVSLRPPVLTPACSVPSPLHGAFDTRAPGYIVVYTDMTNVEASTARLSSKYKFVPNQIWTRALKGFSAQLSPEAVAGLRCEPEVSYVQYIGVSGLSQVGE